MEKIFIIIEVLQKNKVTAGTFYFTEEAYICWNTTKDKFTGLEFTWNKFLGEWRNKFYPITVQRQNEKEFSELR